MKKNTKTKKIKYENIGALMMFLTYCNLIISDAMTSNNILNIICLIILGSMSTLFIKYFLYLIRKGYLFN